jgi:hypothetical protein
MTARHTDTPAFESASRGWLEAAEKVRESKRLSYQAIVDMVAGANKATVSRLFRGQRVRRQLLRDVADVLGLPHPSVMSDHRGPAAITEATPIASSSTSSSSSLSDLMTEWMQVGASMHEHDPQLFDAITNYMRAYQSLRQARAAIDLAMDRMAQGIIPPR